MRKLFVVFVVVLAFGLPAGACAQQPQQEVQGAGAMRENSLARLRAEELQVMDQMVQTYGSADWSALVSAAKAEWNSNYAVPLVAMAQGYLFRYQANKDSRDFARALDFMELALETHDAAALSRIRLYWGGTQASSPTTAFLLLALYRAEQAKVQEPFVSRLDYLRRGIETIASAEADMRLSVDYPYKPYVSGTPQDGDTEAEENAWEASVLAWTSQMFPNHPHAGLWEAKGRELASYSIVRRDEGVMVNGQSFSTVENDYTLINHWMVSPYYSAGTVFLLRFGALAYFLNGQEIPSEFSHGTDGLYAKYKTYCSDDWTWNRPSDPGGDPTLFPLAGMGDDEFEMAVASRKAQSGYLWIPTQPVVGTLQADLQVKGMTPSSATWTAVQNGKVVWYYLAGSYLWHFQP